MQTQSNQAVSKQAANGSLSEMEVLKAKLAELEAENKRLEAKAATKQTVTFRVTVEKKDEKTGKITGTNGAVSLYGLGRFPVTLYKSQWERLIAAIPDLQKFIADNEPKLSVKE